MQSWYYLQGSEQIGPMSETDLLNALKQGIIHSDTLVWCEGMDGWAPLKETPPGQRRDYADSAGAEPAVKPADEGSADTAAPQQKKRLGAVTAFGVLNIVFGCKTLVCLPFSIPLMLVGFRSQPGLFPEWYMVAVLILNPLVFFTGILELASGIGLLKCRLWARKGALVYGACALVLGLLGVLVEATYFFTRIGQASEQTAAAIGGAVGGVLGGVIGLVYPVLLLIFMQKPTVIEACVE